MKLKMNNKELYILRLIINSLNNFKDEKEKESENLC